MHATQAALIGWAQPTGAAAPSGGAPATVSGEGKAGTKAPGGPGGIPPGPCGDMGSATSIVLMLAMFAIFYFLLIRPQQKKAKEHQKMIDSVQKGDEIITAGGLVGRVTGTSDRFLTIEISEKVRVRVVRSQVASKEVATAEKK
ncbi:MAG: preprotein translocase subunit YajC [Deltaproteobacteria bacterium]|nr:preprotein translocase subunit YajC [Deltaproteobacteria bacterium]